MDGIGKTPGFRVVSKVRLRPRRPLYFTAGALLFIGVALKGQMGIEIPLVQMHDCELFELRIER